MSLFFSWPNADAAMSRTVTLATVVFRIRMPHLQRGSSATHEPPVTHDVSAGISRNLNVARDARMRHRDLRASSNAHILRSRSPCSRRLTIDAIDRHYGSTRSDVDSWKWSSVSAGTTRCVCHEPLM